MLCLWHCILIFANYWKVTESFVIKDSSASPNASLLLNLHLFQVVIEYSRAFPLRAVAVKFHFFGLMKSAKLCYLI